MPTTPKWLSDLSTFGAWANIGRAHGPFGKPRLNAAERRQREGIGMLLNVQHRSAVAQAHAMGAKALSYLSFYDTYVHTTGYENGTARIAWDAKCPQMLLLDEQHRFVNTPMDATWRMWRYLVCNNTKEVVERCLAMVRQQMERGADGIFVDNADSRLPCHGHRVSVGYSRRMRMVCVGMPGADADQLAHTGDMVRHTHLYPRQSHDYALVKLLRKTRRLVRSYGRDKVVVVNGNTFAEHVDGGMLESFIYSWAWKGRRQSWTEIQRDAKKWRSYLRRGGCILALSYLGRTRRSIVEDAAFAYAAARLCGYAWSDAGTGKGAQCAALRRLELGPRIRGPVHADGVPHAVFDRGIVALNATSRPRAVRIRLPQQFAHREVMDLVTSRRKIQSHQEIRLHVPAQAGRVYVGLDV